MAVGCTFSGRVNNYVSIIAVTTLSLSKVISAIVSTTPLYVDSVGIEGGVGVDAALYDSAVVLAGVLFASVCSTAASSLSIGVVIILYPISS